ncbi:hypothetical protein [Flaviaesturariibacter amylovorans]|uniref:Uncharacterized protein n=1 Tax=Flaviaesturariibacter amylovorans TaxID=1084520 RepID=A0ABP8HT60_9BACT
MRFCNTLAFAQPVDLQAQEGRLRTLVDELARMQTDTIDCSARPFWQLVAGGRAAIPVLIGALTDARPTRVRHPCKKVPLNVGELAHFALIEIGEFPAFVVTGIQFDVVVIDEKTGASCWSFYDFLFDDASKPRYQESVRSWWAREAGNYHAELVPRAKRSACRSAFGIRRFYRWTDQRS